MKSDLESVETAIDAHNTGGAVGSGPAGATRCTLLVRFLSRCTGRTSSSAASAPARAAYTVGRLVRGAVIELKASVASFTQRQINVEVLIRRAIFAAGFATVRLRAWLAVGTLRAILAELASSRPILSLSESASASSTSSCSVTNALNS